MITDIRNVKDREVVTAVNSELSVNVRDCDIIGALDKNRCPDERRPVHFINNNSLHRAFVIVFLLLAEIFLEHDFLVLDTRCDCFSSKETFKNRLYRSGDINIPASNSYKVSRIVKERIVSLLLNL